MSLKIHCIPILRDNYCWLIGHSNESTVYAVDPGEAAPIVAYLQQHQLTVKAILLTHKHADHTQGVDALKQTFGAPVYGPAGAGYANIETIIEGGETLPLWQSIDINAISTPGHTTNHICYWINNNALSVPHLFCGDTLFSAGCGRLRGGTATQLFESLAWIKQLNENTLVYPTHEYTLANLAFAARVEPNNPSIAEKIKLVTALQMNQTPSLPSTVLIEKQINPFLRCNEPEIQAQINAQFGHTASSEAAYFTLLRQWKDTF